MTVRRKRRNQIHCPRCQTPLTTSNRIQKNFFQAIINPNARRYRCDICRLKFIVNQAKKKPNPSPKRLTEPKKKKIVSKSESTLRTTSKPSSGKLRQPAAAIRKTAATQQISAAAPQRTAPTHRPKPVAKKTNGNIDARVNHHLRAELQRLRKIEKKYRQLKKANRYLAQACRRNRSRQPPAAKRPPSAARRLPRIK